MSERAGTPVVDFDNAEGVHAQHYRSKIVEEDGTVIIESGKQLNAKSRQFAVESQQNEEATVTFSYNPEAWITDINYDSQCKAHTLVLESNGKQISRPVDGLALSLGPRAKFSPHATTPTTGATGTTGIGVIVATDGQALPLINQGHQEVAFTAPVGVQINGEFKSITPEMHSQIAQAAKSGYLLTYQEKHGIEAVYLRFTSGGELFGGGTVNKRVATKGQAILNDMLGQAVTILHMTACERPIGAQNSAVYVTPSLLGVTLNNMLVVEQQSGTGVTGKGVTGTKAMQFLAQNSVSGRDTQSALQTLVLGVDELVHTGVVQEFENSGRPASAESITDRKAQVQRDLAASSVVGGGWLSRFF